MTSILWFPLKINTNTANQQFPDRNESLVRKILFKWVLASKENIIKCIIMPLLTSTEQCVKSVRSSQKKTPERHARNYQNKDLLQNFIR